MPISLFEIPAQTERDKKKATWIVEKPTPAGKKIRYLVKGKSKALVYAAQIGGVVIGKAESHEKQE